MNPHLQRAQMLVGQARYDLADQELRQVLATEPNNAVALGLLAICLVKQEKYDEAKQAAESATQLSPDQPYPHYARAIVLDQCNRLDEAADAVGMAITLDPYDADYYALLASLRFQQQRWKETLETAEEGLSFDPEHVTCINLRAQAQVKLGRKDLATESIESALQHDPDDPYSHANLGWALMEQGDIERALHHFREALRLNPELEWARIGIVEGLKARNILYRGLLKFFLWGTKLSSRARWGLMVGGYFGQQYLMDLAGKHPAWAPWIWPVVIAYFVFAMSTWCAAPLFNLLLRLDKFGKHALSREQIVTANWVGLFVGGAIVSLIAYFAGWHDLAHIFALWLMLVVPPISFIFHCESGWPRWTMLAATAALAIWCFSMIGIWITVGFLDEKQDKNLIVAMLLPCIWLMRNYAYAALGSQFLAAGLAGVQQKR